MKPPLSKCTLISNYRIFLKVFVNNIITTLNNQALFTDTHFLQQLQYRFERQHPEGHLSDIYDGQVYSDGSAFFSDRFNVSFTLNYDGAPKFKSSNMQIWPIQMHVNELPPSLR